MPREDEARPDEAPVTDDTEVLAEEERELREQARALSVANDLDTGPPRHD